MKKMNTSFFVLVGDESFENDGLQESTERIIYRDFRDTCLRIVALQ